MPNPKYENISQMEAAALGEDDDTVSLRLWAHGFTTSWLRVETAEHATYRYFHDVGRQNIEIARDEAQEHIDHEWGRY